MSTPELAKVDKLCAFLDKGDRSLADSQSKETHDYIGKAFQHVMENLRPAIVQKRAATFE